MPYVLVYRPPVPEPPRPFYDSQEAAIAALLAARADLAARGDRGAIALVRVDPPDERTGEIAVATLEDGTDATPTRLPAL